MADQRKELLFTFKVDQTSLQNLKSAIRSITDDMNKLIQTASNISRLGGAGAAPVVGGGGFQSPQGIQTAIKTNSAGPGQNAGLGGVFNSAAGAATSAANAIKNATRSMEADIRSVMNALRQQGPTNNVFSSMPPPMPSAGPGGWLGNFQAGNLGGNRTSFGTGGSVLPGVPMPNVPPPGMAWGSGAAGQYAAQPQNGGGGGFFRGKTRWGGLALGGIAAVGAGYNELVAGGFSLMDPNAGGSAFGSAEAKRGQMVEGNIRAMMKGDTRWLINKMMAENSAQGRNDLAAQHGKLATAGAYASATGQAIGAAANAVPLVGGALGKVAGLLGLGGGDASGGLMGGFTDASIQGKLAQNTFKHLDDKSKSTAMLYVNMAQEKWQSELEQTVGFEQGTGISGLTYDPKTGRTTNRQGDLALKLQARGLNLGQWQSAFQGVRAGAGERAGYSHADEAMRAAAQGYSGYNSVLEASLKLGQTHTLARGAIGGGIDRSAGIMLGAGVLGNGFDVRGNTSGYGTLAAMQAGLGFRGEASDFNRVQQGLAGLKAGDSLMSGALSPYQRGANTAGAIGLNAGGTSYAQDYLATGMSMKQMIDMGYGGKLTQNAQNLGLNQDKIKKMGDVALGNLVNTWHDSGGTDPMSKALRAQASSGLSVSGFLQKARGDGDTGTISAIGTAISTLGGFDEEAAQGLAKTVSGMDAARLKQSGIGGGVTGMAKTQLETNAAQEKKTADVMKIVAGDMDLALKSLPAATQKMAAFGETLSQETKDFVDGLSRLVTAINTARAELAKGSGKAGSK